MIEPTIRIVADEPDSLANAAYERNEPWHRDQAVAALALLVKEALLNRGGKPSTIRPDQERQINKDFDDIVRGHFAALQGCEDEITVRYRYGCTVKPGQEVRYEIMRLEVEKPISRKPVDMLDALIETYRRHTPSRRHIGSFAQVLDRQGVYASAANASSLSM